MAAPKRDALVAKLETLGANTLASLIVDALTSAGAISRWDSATIEDVLSPFVKPSNDLGIPWVGDTCDDLGGHRFWADIADELGVEHDFDPEFDFDENDDSYATNRQSEIDKQEERDRDRE